MGSIITPEAWASRRRPSSPAPRAWRTMTSSRLTPAPKRNARQHRPPIERAATSMTTGRLWAPTRSSAWTGPSRNPSEAAAAATVAASAAWTSAG